MNELELVLLLSELLGLYAVNNSSTYGIVARAQPLTTPHELSAYLDKLSNTTGVAKVRRALNRTCQQAASPMEAKLFLRVTSRPCEGGYQLKDVTLNDSVALAQLRSNITTLRERKPDLLLLSPEQSTSEAMPFRGVAIDYHGAWHARPEQIRADSERQNELLSYGFKNYALWKENYDDLGYMDALMAQIRRDLGLKPRKCSHKLAEQERSARQKLWLELESIDVANLGAHVKCNT